MKLAESLKLHLISQLPKSLKQIPYDITKAPIPGIFAANTVSNNAIREIHASMIMEVVSHCEEMAAIRSAGIYDVLQHASYVIIGFPEPVTKAPISGIFAVNITSEDGDGATMQYEEFTHE